MRDLIFVLTILTTVFLQACKKESAEPIGPGSATPSVSSGWYWQNPKPQGNRLLAVKSIDQNSIVAVGEAGTILRSDDGGTNWNLIASGVSSSLWAIDFADNFTGLATGGDAILKTTNGGTNWVRLSPGMTTTNILSVSIIDGRNAVALDIYTVLRTTDGGLSWISQFNSSPIAFKAVKMLDSLIVYALKYDGTILRTTDGGVTWATLSIGSQFRLWSFDFVSANTGVCVGIEGTILRTTDGGLTWSQRASSTIQDLYGVSFSDPNNGVIGGGEISKFESVDTSVILRTSDGGLTWTSLYKGRHPLYGVSYQGSRAIAVGKYGSIIRSASGGSNWESMRSGTTDSFEDVWFTDTHNGIAAGGQGGLATILRTTNGGSSWTKQATNVEQWLTRIHFMNASIGTVVGWQGAVLRTSDGGATWVSRQVSSNSLLWSVFFIDENTGFVGGTNGIYKTVDGGFTWVPQLGSARVVRELHFVDANVGFAVGEIGGSFGRVWRTTNGGGDWIFDSSGLRLGRLSFIDLHTGFSVVGASILKTTDGGMTWNQVGGIALGVGAGLSFADLQNGIAVGSESIFRTSDGGVHWVIQKSGTNNRLNAVSMPTADFATVVGHYGTILNTTTGGQ